MFTTVNEHEPLIDYVQWLFTDTLRDEAKMVKPLHFYQCCENIMENFDTLVSATKLLHEEEKGKDCHFTSLVAAGATGHVHCSAIEKCCWCKDIWR